MRFCLFLSVLIIGLMISFAEAAVQPLLLVVIIFLLLYQQFQKRDFYVRLWPFGGAHAALQSA
jgi:hypothetical protein